MTSQGTASPPITIEVVSAGDPRRRVLEDEAIAANVRLSASGLEGAERVVRACESFLLVARLGGGIRGTLGITEYRSRVPGFSIWRVERLGGADASISRALIERAVGLARGRGNVLRIVAETFTTDDATAREIANALASAGFEPQRCTRMYESTILLDLIPDEAELFASFHATARRHVRAVGKNPVVVSPISDPALAPRLDDLLHETVSRTGGDFLAPDWGSLIRLCARRPDRSRLVGLFRDDMSGPEALLGFAWGCNHGDHTHYATAASTRSTELKVPILYPLVWDLICWSRRSGARTFDFGGVSQGSHGTDDRLGGISDFKRYFSRDVVRVGSQWSLDTSVAARLVNKVSSVTRRLRR